MLLHCLFIKKNPFCTYSEEYFLKDGKNYNHWVGHSVTKPVDIEYFQIKKYIKEGGYDKYDDFDIYIGEKCALDNADIQIGCLCTEFLECLYCIKF